MELRAGRMLRFAASTRQYRLSKQGSAAGAQPSAARAPAQPAASGGFAAPPPPKRQKSDPASEAASTSTQGGLSSLAGYSEDATSPDAGKAGPALLRASQGSNPGDDPAEGRFARAVKYTTLQDQNGDDGGSRGGEAGPAGKPAKTTPLSRKGSEEQRRPSWLLTQQPKARSGGLYGTLPPPSSSGTPV